MTEEQVVESRRRRKLQVDVNSFNFTDNRYWIQDTTTQVGRGDGPGVPNQDYLGDGYKVVTGNPRGSFTSELDQGMNNQLSVRIMNEGIVNPSYLR